MSATILVALVVADLATGRGHSIFTPMLVLIAPLTALHARPAWVAVMGVLALAGRIGMAEYVGQLRERPGIYVGLASSYLAITLFSMYTARLREVREAALRSVTSVAETAQRAVLQPPDPVVGTVRTAVRYASATAEAQVGGDLYEVVLTPFGTRVVVGDVQGKGLSAVQTTARVLGAFREAAQYERTLTTVAAKVEACVARSTAPDAFVTAVFVELTDEAALTLVSCGHVPPLLVGPGGSVRPLEAPDVGAPLGLSSLAGGIPSAWTAPMQPDEILVLYTDGVTEARSQLTGIFYPLEERLRLLCSRTPAPPITIGRPPTTPTETVPNRDGSLEDLATRLYADLVHYVGGGLTDDAVLLLLSKARSSG
ncbi:PP2C family protein-serine/threonine phosphatase [Actinomycetota bacterium Odt1-20B]